MCETKVSEREGIMKELRLAVRSPYDFFNICTDVLRLTPVGQEQSAACFGGAAAASRSLSPGAGCWHC